MKTHRVQTGEEGQTLTVAQSTGDSPTVTAGTSKVDKVCRSYRKKRRGAQAVEFAIVAPIFILLVFGMIEFGRMIMVKQLMTNAAREGARRAVLDGVTEGDVKAVVENYLDGSSVPVDQDDITVSPNPETATFGQAITVSVEVDHSAVSWLPGSFFPTGSTLGASAVMRRESVQ